MGTPSTSWTHRHFPYNYLVHGATRDMNFPPESDGGCAECECVQSLSHKVYDEDVVTGKHGLFVLAIIFDDSMCIM